MLSRPDFLYFFRFLLSSSDEDDEEEEDGELEESDSDEESESLLDATATDSDVIGAKMGIFGTEAKCSLKSSVSPPRPIEVKKLIANRVFLGLSRGKSPSKA